MPTRIHKTRQPKALFLTSLSFSKELLILSRLSMHASCEPQIFMHVTFLRLLPIGSSGLICSDELVGRRGDPKCSSLDEAASLAEGHRGALGSWASEHCPGKRSAFWGTSVVMRMEGQNGLSCTSLSASRKEKASMRSSPSAPKGTR